MSKNYTVLITPCSYPTYLFTSFTCSQIFICIMVIELPTCKSFFSYFTVNSSLHICGTRQREDLHISSVSTTLYKRSIG